MFSRMLCCILFYVLFSGLFLLGLSFSVHAQDSYLDGNINYSYKTFACSIQGFAFGGVVSNCDEFQKNLEQFIIRDTSFQTILSYQPDLLENQSKLDTWDCTAQYNEILLNELENLSIETPLPERYLTVFLDPAVLGKLYSRYKDVGDSFQVDLLGQSLSSLKEKYDTKKNELDNRPECKRVVLDQSHKTVLLGEESYRYQEWSCRFNTKISLEIRWELSFFAPGLAKILGGYEGSELDVILDGEYSLDFLRYENHKGNLVGYSEDIFGWLMDEWVRDSCPRYDLREDNWEALLIEEIRREYSEFIDYEVNRNNIQFNFYKEPVRLVREKKIEGLLN